MTLVGILIAALLSALWLLWPRKITITRVVDGDSFEGAISGRPVRVRIAGYDAPEYRQPFGREARTALAAIISGKSVRIWYPGRDKYGRILGVCTIGLTPLSWRMVSAGCGWPNSTATSIISLVARLRRRGLWQSKNRIHPSTWRRAAEEQARRT